jgi:hypothetical protein
MPGGIDGWNLRGEVGIAVRCWDFRVFWDPLNSLTSLLAISEDIAAFEEVNSPILLEELVPEEWQLVFVGRAYDMTVGPRH